MNEPLLRELERGFAELLLNSSRVANAPQTAANDPDTRTFPSNCNQESTTTLDATAQINPTACVRERLPQIANYIDQLDHRGKKLARDDRNTRRKQERENRTLCVSCKQRKPPGTAMFTCSLCKSVNYCSKQCQRDDWTSVHRQECTTFAHPPLAKSFDTSHRLDVPWPIDPVFASTHEDGVGIWVSVSTSEDMSALLQTACTPPEGLKTGPQPYGPPSFLRWAGLRPDSPQKREWGIEVKKYIGPTLANLRFVIQNRRRDGRALVVTGAETALVAFDHLKGCILLEDLSEVMFETIGEGKQLMHVLPWRDYNKRFRVSILEINGTLASHGHFSPTTDEYVCADRPTGPPWERVVNWDMADIALAPGDFVVFCAQYRVGDGHSCDTYPEAMTRCGGVIAQCYLTDAKGTDCDWCGSAGRQMLLSRALAHGRAGLPPNVIVLRADIDHDYLDEYYKPYFEEGLNAFSAQRYGKAAKAQSDRLKKSGPEEFERMLDTLPPDARRMFVGMYSSMTVECMHAGSAPGICVNTWSPSNPEDKLWQCETAKHAETLACRSLFHKMSYQISNLIGFVDGGREEVTRDIVSSPDDEPTDIALLPILAREPVVNGT
ncbi:uncharacterized protein SCHCODRAFT_02692194 [Schizophyllum commune H4-8]|nr:uncharacterized protein SCHCODRAFT_02692194 [Schizophyllum commune H4-8]KAI5887458.1 hypothetical protein SCHCODRAFT_02692194 [Schizophyllum commune H4-8]